MRGMESIKGNWFAILNKRETVPGNCFDVPSSLAVLSQLGVLLMLVASFTHWLADWLSCGEWWVASNIVHMALNTPSLMMPNPVDKWYVSSLYRIISLYSCGRWIPFILSFLEHVRKLLLRLGGSPKYVQQSTQEEIMTDKLDDERMMKSVSCISSSNPIRSPTMQLQLTHKIFQLSNLHNRDFPWAGNERTTDDFYNRINLHPIC